MTTSNRGSSPKPPESLLDLELPPLDSDELFEIDRDTMADLLDTDYESLPEETSMDIAPDPSELLSDFEESSWIVDGEEEAPMNVDLSGDLDESDWAVTDGEDSPMAIDWFEPEIGDDTPEDDGAEGPVHKELYEIEESRWDALDDGEDEEEDILVTMERLGMMEEMFAVSSDNTGFESPLSSADISFLGPDGGGVKAVVFSGETPVAVGDSVFVLGADDRLHAVGARSGNLGATSVTMDERTMFVGTRRSGVYLSRDRGSTLHAVNSWYTQGLKSSGSPLDEISTSFSVTGQQTSNGFRLYGVTTEGQLFWSLDHGVTWHGPVPQGRCAMVTPLEGTDRLLAVFDSQPDGVDLSVSEDLENWRSITFPESLRDPLSRGATLLTGCDSTIILCDTERGILHRSLDLGESWERIESMSEAETTAIALDSEDSSWMAVALLDREGPRAEVRVSESGGESWRTVLIIKPARDDLLAEAPEHITALSVSNIGPRRLAVVCGRGVYRVKLSERSLAH